MCTHSCVTAVDTIQRIATYLTELLWPPRCAACGHTTKIACATCLASLVPPRRSQAHRHEYLDRLVSATSLTPTVESFVYALKYRGVRALATPLADRMCDLLSLRRDAVAMFGPNPLIVPVPLHASRLRERGFNQADLLAGRIASTTAMILNTTSLVRVRPTHQQAKTSNRAQRRDNMSGAFAVQDTHAILDRDIVLIDDICTTGATLDECAHALKEAGARTVSAIVVAHG